jgi:hypothetical protein
MLHKNSHERYEKLKRLFRRLMRRFNVDDLDDFIATANSMPEWMKNDPSLVQEQQDAIARFTVDVRSTGKFAIRLRIARSMSNRRERADLRCGSIRCG